MERDRQNVEQPEKRGTKTTFPEAAINIERGVAHHRERRLELGVFTLGSGKDCDLILGDEQFPELFAYILRIKGEYHLRCLTAEPLLTVNAQDVVAARLEEGDRIRCGPYEFRFRRIASSPARPAEEARQVLPALVPAWTATDGRSDEGLAASRQLIQAIQKSLLTRTAPAVRHRRSA